MVVSASCADTVSIEIADNSVRMVFFILLFDYGLFVSNHSEVERLSTHEPCAVDGFDDADKLGVDV